MAATLVRPRWRLSPAWRFLLPAVALYAVFFLWPILRSFWLIFFSWKGVGPVGPFVGLDNVEELLHDPSFRSAVAHNLVILVVLLLVTNTVSLGLAYLLKDPMPLGGLYRAIIALPYILSPLVTGFIWLLLANPEIGLVNAGLEAIGLESLTQEWLADPQWALFVVALAVAWQWNGLATLIFIARFQDVPTELVDAAKVDGAGGVRVFWHVMLPQLAPAFTIANVLATIYALRVFDLVYVIGGPVGAPAGSTLVMGTSIYGTAFGLTAFSADTNMSYAMAQGVAQFLLVAVVALPLLVYLRRRERRVL